MIKQNQLLETPEYWFERIQNLLYEAVIQYLEEENMTQTQLAEKLGVSKGYISQILNGNYNHSLKKLVEISLAVGVVPDIQFRSLESTERKKFSKTITLSNLKVNQKTLSQYSIENDTKIIPLHSKSSFNYSLKSHTN